MVYRYSFGENVKLDVEALSIFEQSFVCYIKYAFSAGTFNLMLFVINVHFKTLHNILCVGLIYLP